MAQICLPEPLLAQLEIERWNTLTPEEYSALARALTERFHVSGVRLTAPRLEHCGPHQEQAVIFWHEETTRLDFALIPGGTLLPRYDAAQLERYAHIY